MTTIPLKCGVLKLSMKKLITCPSGQVGIHSSSATDYAEVKGISDNVIVVNQSHAM